MKIKSLAAATILLTSMHFSAWAACQLPYARGGGNYTAQLGGMQVPDFNPGDISLHGTIFTYQGSPVFTNSTLSAQSAAVTDCLPLANTHVTGIGAPTEIPDPLTGGREMMKVYPTSMYGIGVTFSDTGGRKIPYTTKGAYSSSSFNLNYGIIVRLIKMGDITAQGSLFGPFLQYRDTHPAGQLFVNFSFANAVVISPRVPTCEVGTRSATYDLRKVFAQVFRGINTVAPQRTPFNLELNCSGGDPGTSTRAFVSFTDANQPANTSTALSLIDTTRTTGEPPASGVGVQIVRDVNGSEQAVRFGPDSSTPGAANQWFAGTIPRGQRQFVIPLKARYVQTASTIKAGQVSAQARFTISYQ